MSNLTIALDDALIRKARIKAVQEGTTINAVVRERLKQYASAGGQEPPHVRATREFLALAKRAKGRSSGTRWTREEINERR